VVDGGVVDGGGGVTARPGPRLVVPAYFHPAVRPADWATLAGWGSAVRLVVLNLADGPGPIHDPAFDAPLAAVRAAGAAVACYVDTGYRSRPVHEVAADLARYRDRYPADRTVFFDRVSATGDDLDHYAGLAERARAVGMGTVVFNHGVHPDPAYARYADLLGTFEGTWEQYRRAVVPRWARQRDPAGALHLVDSVPRRRLAQARALVARHGAGAAYITDAAADRVHGPNPWRRLPAIGPW